MPSAIAILRETWAVTAQMAPYLLIGFAAAGLLSLVLTGPRVERFVGGSGWLASLKAVIVGIPAPLCSCSVIPVTAALRKHGAGPGAAAAFLTATPQTGVDSILATQALLGPWFTAYRVVAAFISGMITGIAVDALSGKEKAPAQSDPGTAPCGCCCGNKAATLDGAPVGESSDAVSGTPAPAWSKAMRFGFFDLPGDIGAHLLVGLLISGIIGATVPPDVLSSMSPPWYVSYALAMAVGLPLYVCSTASIPIASAMIASGLSPGAALVFLIVGPATNAATIAVSTNMLGGRGCAVYLGSLIATSWVMGLIADALPLAPSVAAYAAHSHEAVSVGHHAAAVAIILLLIAPIISKWRQRRACACD